MTGSPPTARSRRAAAAILSIAGFAGVGAGLLVDLGSADAASSAGPTALAEARDLDVTDDEAGTLARSDTTTVVYDGTGGSVGGGPSGSQVTGQSTGDATVAQITPTQDCTADPTGCETTTTTEPPTTTTPTTEPPPQTVPSLVPDDTAPDDTVPEDTAPEEMSPEESAPEEQVGERPTGNDGEVAPEGDTPTDGGERGARR